MAENEESFDPSKAEEYLDRFKNAVLGTPQCINDLTAILFAPDKTIHYGLEISFSQLVTHDPLLCSYVLKHPDEMIKILDFAIVQVEQEIFDDHEDQREMSVKENIHVRMRNLPGPNPHHHKENVSEIRASDFGRLIQMSGTVIRTSEIRMLITAEEHKCLSCGFQFRVESELEENNTIRVPKVCPSPAAGRKKCQSRNIKYVDNSRVCQDYQELRIQEQVQRLTVGSIPRSIKVVVKNDLADACLAGDDLVIIGVVRRMWNGLSKTEFCDLEIFIEAWHMSVSDTSKKAKLNIGAEIRHKFAEYWMEHRKTPIHARNMILANVCPQLYGMSLVKLSLAITIIGGVARTESGVNIRGESHMLLVGDPGVGKSQLLKYAAKVLHRSVSTTGVGTTSAGLTCSAAHQEGQWTLEAGALVLADRGICCIDEFSSIREHDRATIHEAMEQQTLSVAKAGLVCTLNTRTTVLAALNPKGPYDGEADLSVNCAIASPLLSRFDIILLMLDTRDLEWDERVSGHIMKNLRPLHDPLDEENVRVTQPMSMTSFLRQRAPPTNGWSLEHMKAYFAYAKSIEPTLTQTSQRIIQAYFQLQRRADSRSQARTTIRLLESLIRVAQAHARLMLRPRVLVSDAVQSVVLIEKSMQSAQLVDVQSVLHSDFPADADKAYKAQEKAILERLQIAPNEILEADRHYDYADINQRLKRIAAMNSPKPRNSGTPSKGGGGDGASSSTLGGPPSSQMPISLSFAVSSRAPDIDMSDVEHKHDSDAPGTAASSPRTPRARDLSQSNFRNGERGPIGQNSDRDASHMQQDPPDINFDNQGEGGDMNFGDGAIGDGEREGEPPRLSRSVSFRLSDEDEDEPSSGRPHAANSSHGKSSLRKPPRHSLATTDSRQVGIPSSPIVPSHHQQQRLATSTSRQPDGGFTRPSSRPTPSRLNFSSQNSNASTSRPSGLSSQTPQHSRQPVENNLLSWKPPSRKQSENSLQPNRGAGSNTSSSRQSHMSSNAVPRPAENLPSNRGDEGGPSQFSQSRSSSSSQLSSSSTSNGFRRPQPKKSLRKRSAPSPASNSSQSAASTSQSSASGGNHEPRGGQFKRPRANFRPPRPITSSQRELDHTGCSQSSQPRNLSQHSPSHSQHGSQPAKSGLTQFQYNSSRQRGKRTDDADQSLGQGEAEYEPSQRTALREISQRNSQAKRKQSNLLHPKKHPHASAGVNGGGGGLANGNDLSGVSSSQALSSQDVAPVSQSFSQLMQQQSSDIGQSSMNVDDLCALDDDMDEGDDDGAAEGGGFIGWSQHSAHSQARRVEKFRELKRRRKAAGAEES